MVDKDSPSCSYLFFTFVADFKFLGSEVSGLECHRNRDCVGVRGAGNTFKDEIWVKFAKTDIVEMKIIGFGDSW